MTTNFEYSRFNCLRHVDPPGVYDKEDCLFCVTPQQSDTEVRNLIDVYNLAFRSGKATGRASLRNEIKNLLGLI